MLFSVEKSIQQLRTSLLDMKTKNALKLILHLVLILLWSGSRDSNPGPHAPKACALASCATPRKINEILRSKIFINLSQLM